MPEWVRVATAAECGPGQVLGVTAGNERIALINVEGDFYALLDRCSHQDYPLSDGELDGTRLECIYHGARFDVCSGRAMQLPAIRPVKTFPVEVREGAVFVEV
jgi:3-phenylpropionate/trans-cinnamate dioxygenase ferredoxin component